MPYYCKKCGAVVSGKYCSCCGTRATDDLKAFRLEVSRRRRAFCSARDSRGALLNRLAADFSWLTAEDSVLRPYHLTVYTFPQVADLAYREIRVIEEKAEQLYEGVLMTARIVL